MGIFINCFLSLKVWTDRLGALDFFKRFVLKLLCELRFFGLNNLRGELTEQRFDVLVVLEVFREGLLLLLDQVVVVVLDRIHLVYARPERLLLLARPDQQRKHLRWLQVMRVRLGFAVEAEVWLLVVVQDKLIKVYALVFIEL